MSRKLNRILEPVTSNIFIVSTKGNGRYPYCYTFFVKGEKNLVIDPNCDVPGITALRDSADVSAVVISHSHPDHMATAWLFNDAQILCPDESPEGISSLDFLAYRATGGGEEAEIWKEFMTTELSFRPVAPTGFFSDGDYLLDEPKIRLRAIHAPGHSRDHYVFFEEKSGTLFSSDIDFTDFGPWYGYEECSINEFRNSLEKIRELPVKIALSSHVGLIKDNITEEIDRFEQGFERHKEKIRSLLRISGGSTIDELAAKSPFYKIKHAGPGYMKRIEAWMIRHLLKEMMDSGEVQKIDTGRQNDIFKSLYKLHI